MNLPLYEDWRPEHLSPSIGVPLWEHVVPARNEFLPDPQSRSLPSLGCYLMIQIHTAKPL